MPAAAAPATTASHLVQRARQAAHAVHVALGSEPTDPASARRPGGPSAPPRRARRRRPPPRVALAAGVRHQGLTRPRHAPRRPLPRAPPASTAPAPRAPAAPPASTCASRSVAVPAGTTRPRGSPGLVRRARADGAAAAAAQLGEGGGLEPVPGRARRAARGPALGHERGQRGLDERGLPRERVARVHAGEHPAHGGVVEVRGRPRPGPRGRRPWAASA